MDGPNEFSAREGLVYSQDGDVCFVTDLESGMVFELNETAAKVFQEAQHGSSLHLLSQSMQESYPDVPVDEIQKDLKEITEEMVRCGLLETATRGD